MIYGLLAPGRQETLTAEQFVDRYTEIATEATLKSVQASLVSSQGEGDDAKVEFTAIFATNAVGTFQQDNLMLLQRQENRRGVLWSPSLIFKQLTVRVQDIVNTF